MENKSRDSLNCDIIATGSLFNIFAKEKCSQSFYSLANDKSADSFCAKIYLVHPPHWILQTCGTAHFVHNLAQENWAFTLGEWPFNATCTTRLIVTNCYQHMQTVLEASLKTKGIGGNSCCNTSWAMSNLLSRGIDLCTVAQSVAHTTALHGEVLVAAWTMGSGSHLCLFIHLSQLNLGVILKQGSTVLHFSFLDPVAVNSEGTAINHLSQCLDAIWVGPCDVQREWLRCVS